jgi:hypothetical protein
MDFESVELTNNVKVTTDNKTKKFRTIQNLHLAAFLFFLVQSIAYIAASASNNDISVKPTVGFSNKECTSAICNPGMKILGTANPIFLIPLFVALACVDHLVAYLYCKYNSSSAQYWIFTIGSNPFRWIEYSLSASFMAIAISILSGIHDVHLWLLIFFMHAIGMILGLIIEILPKKDAIYDNKSETVEQPTTLTIKISLIRNIIYALSSVSIFTPWLVICCYFFRNVTANGANVPDFVYVAFLGTLILFITFAVNSFLHNILGYYNFATAEIVYISLSFTAKTFLAADVFGGLAASSN